MGSSFYPLKSGIKRTTRPPNSKAPKRSLQELADEFGVTRGHLNGCLAADPDAPRACLRCGGSPTHGASSYYEPKAMREWWQKHQLAIAGKGQVAIKNVATKRKTTNE